MKQLLMMRFSCENKIYTLPEGYSYSFYKGSQEEINDWLSICLGGLIPDLNPEHFENAILRYPDLVPEEDLFFVVREKDGKRVATSASVRHANGKGYIHMVAALPEVRGLGIGHAMLYHSISILEKRGCKVMDLTTDDFRLSAIKTYLDGGFRPVLWEDPESDMKERWDKVISSLHYPPVEYYPE